MYKDLERRRLYKLEYQKKWVAKRRSDFFKDKRCINCNSVEKLELHHVNPDDKESHKIWSWCEEKRLKEIAKCVILCRSCHSKVTAEYNSRPITHGDSGYDRGCRCNICSESHSNRMSLWRIYDLKRFIFIKYVLPLV